MKNKIIFTYLIETVAHANELKLKRIEATL